MTREDPRRKFASLSIASASAEWLWWSRLTAGHDSGSELGESAVDPSWVKKSVSRLIEHGKPLLQPYRSKLGLYSLAQEQHDQGFLSKARSSLSFGPVALHGLQTFNAQGGGKQQQKEEMHHLSLAAS